MERSPSLVTTQKNRCCSNLPLQKMEINASSLILSGFSLERVNKQSSTDSFMHVGVSGVSRMRGCNHNYSFCDGHCYSPRHAPCHHFSAMVTRDGVTFGRSALQIQTFSSEAKRRHFL